MVDNLEYFPRSSVEISFADILAGLTPDNLVAYTLCQLGDARSVNTATDLTREGFPTKAITGGLLEIDDLSIAEQIELFEAMKTDAVVFLVNLSSHERDRAFRKVLDKMQEYKNYVTSVSNSGQALQYLKDLGR